MSSEAITTVSIIKRPFVGSLLSPGDMCRVPARIARQWIAAGWAKRVKQHRSKDAARS